MDFYIHEVQQAFVLPELKEVVLMRIRQGCGALSGRKQYVRLETSVEVLTWSHGHVISLSISSNF